MPMTTIAGHEVEVNEEGFLTKPDEWTEELAPELAKLIGLELGDGTEDGIGSDLIVAIVGERARDSSRSGNLRESATAVMGQRDGSAALQIDP